MKSPQFVTIWMTSIKTWYTANNGERGEAMLEIQKPYTPSDGRVFRHRYMHAAMPGAARSVPRAVETAAAGRAPVSPTEHPVEATTSAFSLAPASEPQYRATLEPESPA